MESTESTRKKRDKMKQIDQTQGDEQLVNQNQQISNTTTGQYKKGITWIHHNLSFA
jgi:hypothetical protein